MNAYELADEFDWMTEEKIVQWCNDVVNMLRQQADRIAELEKQLSQPMQILDDGRIVPVFKDLSDEEIDGVGDEVSNLIDTYAGRREFARAILRKAQEK